jgi:hypothetical protein
MMRHMTLLELVSITYTIIGSRHLLLNNGLIFLKIELEETTGRDPFANGIVNFRTAGALANLYAETCPE